LNRRRVPTAEFELDRDPLAWAVLERLTQDRLLTRSDGWVEVSHEALIRRVAGLGVAAAGRAVAD
jgi:hypothetical protein